mmetsp:Transcript_36133/g.93221  ORF Transcript_36133/g.93221 Transcript_36133/m.93221 type:complete len:203 (+) Transcript_36133:757-1365(+)
MDQMPQHRLRRGDEGHGPRRTRRTVRNEAGALHQRWLHRQGLASRHGGTSAQLPPPLSRVPAPMLRRGCHRERVQSAQASLRLPHGGLQARGVRPDDLPEGTGPPRGRLRLPPREVPERGVPRAGALLGPGGTRPLLPLPPPDLPAQRLRPVDGPRPAGAQAGLPVQASAVPPRRLRRDAAGPGPGAALRARVPPPPSAMRA